MIDPTYTSLVNEIKEKTIKGLLPWIPSSYASTYETPLGNGAVTIMFDDARSGGFGISSDYSPIATLSFYNARGEVFNTISCYLADDEFYADLKAIYDAAYNNYMKIDETLKSMFDDLNSRSQQ